MCNSSACTFDDDDCNIDSCLNGGTYNGTTCLCQCANYYNGRVCEKICSTNQTCSNGGVWSWTACACSELKNFFNFESLFYIILCVKPVRLDFSASRAPTRLLLHAPQPTLHLVPRPITLAARAQQSNTTVLISVDSVPLKKCTIIILLLIS